MFQLNPNKKQLDKYFSSVKNDDDTPINWIDFAKRCKIRSSGNIVNFNPYHYQIKLVELMLNHSVCVVKSRQLGISETVTNFMLWRACLNPGYLGLVFSKTQTDSSLLARRIRRMIESLGLKTTTENLSDIEIKGKGRILFRNSNPDSARGIESVVDVFFDEYAFLDNAKEIFDAVTPSQQMLGDKSRMFIVSTPNGKSGHYWDILNQDNGERDIISLCETANNKDNSFQFWIDSGNWGKVIIHWKTHPIYGKDSNFLNDIHIKKKMSLATINQEYNLSFIESESNYFSYDIVRKNVLDFADKNDDDGFYFMGIDSATTGKDYAVCVVLKYVNDVFYLIDIYRKRESSSEYHLYHIGEKIEKYNPSMVGIETTGGVGQVWLEQLSKAHFGTKIKKIITTNETKNTMLDRLKLMIECGKMKYRKDSPLIDEMLNFKRIDNKLQSSSGKHDDVIMATSFALAVAEIWGV